MSELDWAVEAAPFEVSLTRIGGLAYARLSGEADICGWQALNEMAYALTAEQTSSSEVVIDLTQLRFACARTMLILDDLCNRLSARGIPTQVRGMQPLVARVAALVGVDLPTAAKLGSQLRESTQPAATRPAV